ncbi:MAG: hypothetical protein II942_00045 [Alphaproteobacteria bacterium]|nr:hypothetical protein [Alphaproteobacteria bacterium]
MKKILMLSVCFAISGAVAQGLFPELNSMYGDNAGEPAAAVPAVAADEEERDLPSITNEDTETIEDGDVVEKVSKTEDLFATPEGEEEVVEEEVVAEEETPEEEEEDDQKIIIYPSEMNSTIVPNNNFSYCMGTIKFASTIKRPVKRLKVSLNYGELSADYDIRNLTNKEEKSKELILVGTSCEHVLDTPQIDIQECVVEGMTAKACKEKVVFSPLR